MSERDPDNPDAPSEPFTRPRACVELAERFVALLAEEHSHQLGVCGQLGIAYATYKRWMTDDEDAAPEVAAFRKIVLAGLDAQRRKDLKAAEDAVDDAPGTHAATVWNMRKFRHESRFKRFYADEPVKVEHSGKDGGKIELGLSAKELLDLYAKARKDAEEGE